MIMTGNHMDLWQGRVDDGSVLWHQSVQDFAKGAQSGLALVGFACDEGVRRNQGRVGAAQGPNSVRRALSNLAWHSPYPVYDFGNINCDDGDLEAAQNRLAQAITDLIQEKHLPIVVGGGHEVSFASWLGLAGAQKNKKLPQIGIINFDAHFDLRDPLAGRSSGTPFAQIAHQCAELGWPFQYACIGISRANNTKALFERAKDLGAFFCEDYLINEAYLPALQSQLHAFVDRCDVIHLSVDLDVFPSADAPGVSAPAARGVPLYLLEPLLMDLLASGKVALVDIAELNPAFDIDNHTAKLAARLVHMVSLFLKKNSDISYSNETKQGDL